MMEKRVVILLLLSFLTPAQAVYKGKLTCANLETFLKNLPDGRIRAYCDDANYLCEAQKSLMTLKPDNILRAEFDHDLKEKTLFQLGLCELGFLTYATDKYSESLAR